MHMDTSFVVDLLREHARWRPGRATSFLEEHAGEHLRVGIHAVCELHAGAELPRESAAERRRVRLLCAALDIAYPDDRFPLVYGASPRDPRARRTAHRRHGPVIATAALVDAAPVVTRRPRIFLDPRSEGLDVLTPEQPVSLAPGGSPFQRISNI